MGTQWISWGTGGFIPKSLQIQDGKWRASIGFWGTIFSVKTTAIPIIARQDFRAPGAQGHTPSPISPFHGWYKPSPSGRFMVLGWLHCSSSVKIWQYPCSFLDTFSYSVPQENASYTLVWSPPGKVALKALKGVEISYDIWTIINIINITWVCLKKYLYWGYMDKPNKTRM
jgi:hypothetical protein